MIRKIMAAMMAFLFTITLSVPAQAEDESSAFDAFLEEEFVDTMESDYLTMHYSVRNYRAYGIEKPEPIVGDASWQSFSDAEEAAQEALENLESFDYSALSRSQQVDYDSYHFYLEGIRDLNHYPQLNDYFNPSSGILNNLLTNFTEFVFYEKEDVEDYLKVLLSTPEFMEDALDVTRKQAENGFFLNDTMLDDAHDMIDEFTAKKEDNQLIVIFDEDMDACTFLSGQEKADYKKQNREIVLNEIIPCYIHAGEELEKLRGSRNFSDGLYNYKDGGKEYYRALARYKSSSDMSIEDQIELFEEFLEDLIDEYVMLYMRDSSIDRRFDNQTVKMSSPEEILEFLKNHLQNYPEGPEVSYKSSYLDPSVANDSVVAYYMPPPFDDIRNNVIKINGESVEDENALYETLAHEGFPGHLYQNTWYLATNPAKIRTCTDLIGYSEGWAMYTEMCAWEDAGLDEDVARLHQIWTALGYCEDAAVDLGVNGLGWDVDDVANFLDGVGLNTDYAQDLVDFVVERPGMILPYGCGIVRFWNMREDAEERLGDKFDIVAFNTVLLEGGCRPFEMVEEDVEQYIQETLRGGKKPTFAEKTEKDNKGSTIAPENRPESSPKETPQFITDWENKKKKNASSAVPYIAGIAVFTLAAAGALAALTGRRKKDPFA